MKNQSKVRYRTFQLRSQTYEIIRRRRERERGTRVSLMYIRSMIGMPRFEPLPGPGTDEMLMQPLSVEYFIEFGQLRVRMDFCLTV